MPVNWYSGYQTREEQEKEGRLTFVGTTDGNGTRTEDHYGRQSAEWKNPVYASGYIPVNDLNLVYSSIMIFFYTFEYLLFHNECNICPKVC